jgi:hypothetical protein
MRPFQPPLSRHAEAAAQRGELGEALRGFLEAGDRACQFQLWRSAVRHYRSALELDVIRREPVARIVKIAPRIGNQGEWSAYARVLDDTPDWPHFGCRSARVLAHDTGTVVECVGVGPVLELAMVSADAVLAQPDGRFAKMPLAMALVILRRALWPAPRELSTKPTRVRVTLAGRSAVWLDERGDWARV